MLKVGFWISIGNLIFYLLYYIFGLNLLALLPDMEVWCNAKIIIAYIIALIATLGLIITLLAIKKDNNIKKWMVVVSVLVSFFMIVYQVDFALYMQEKMPEIVDEFNNQGLNNDESDNVDKEQDDEFFYGIEKYKNLWASKEDIKFTINCYNEVEKIKDKLINKIQQRESKSIEAIISEFVYDDEIKIHVTKDMASLIKDEDIQDKLIFQNSEVKFYGIDFIKFEDMILENNIKTNLFTNENKYNGMYFTILIDKEGNLYVNPDDIVYDDTKFYDRFDEESGLAYVKCINEIENILSSVNDTQRKNILNYCVSEDSVTKESITYQLDKEDIISLISNEEVKKIVYKQYNKDVAIFNIQKFVEYLNKHSELPECSKEIYNKIYNKELLMENNKLYILPNQVVYRCYSWDK